MDNPLLTTTFFAILLTSIYFQTVSGEGSCKWTDWLDRDNTGGTGDFETFTDQNQLNGFSGCTFKQIEMRVVGTTTIYTSEAEVLAGNGDIVHIVPSVGMYCRWSSGEQPDNSCFDYEVRFCCATTTTTTTTTPTTTTTTTTTTFTTTTTTATTCPASTCCSATYLEGGACTETSGLSKKVKKKFCSKAKMCTNSMGVFDTKCTCCRSCKEHNTCKKKTGKCVDPASVNWAHWNFDFCYNRSVKCLKRNSGMRCVCCGWKNPKNPQLGEGENVQPLTVKSVYGR